MFKLLKRYGKPFIVMFLCAVVLLSIQAYGDLTLPEFMSNIVNTGIQQGGIHSAAPEAMSQETYEKVMFFIPQDKKQAVTDSYSLSGKATLPDKDYEKYVKKYPSIETQNIYILNTSDKDIIAGFQNDIGVAFIAINAIAQGKTMEAGATMPVLTDSMILQTAAPLIKAEYTSLGANPDDVQMGYIYSMGGTMLILSLIISAAAISQSLLSSRIAAGISKHLRKDVFAKVVNFSNAEFDKFSTASLITRSTNDVQQIQQLIGMMIRIVVLSPIMGIGGVLKVIKSDSSMTWIIGVAVGAIILIVVVFFSIAVPKFSIIQKLIDKVNLVMRESLTGMLVIRAFGTQRHEEHKFDEANKDLTKTNLFIGRMMSTLMPLMTIIMNFTTVLIVWVGAKSIDMGTMQVGNMMAFIQYTMQIIMSFLFLSMISIMLPRATVAAKRILEILDTETTILDPENPKSFAANDGSVEFKNVSFKYPDANEYILQDISFKAKPKQTTAFIGSTGSGKSTLINLIPRFYDVTDGEILINGTNIKNVTQEALRDDIGYIPQKGLLFSGTIESNIKFAGEFVTDDAMKKAADIAQARDFIDSKPDKFNEPISQGGANVSGGQKQRLSIARAIAKNPKIYIFDDSFSALDFKTDAALRNSLDKNIKDATILIVAQRIGTIKNAQQIVVLDEGKTVGIGTHKELLKNCDVYKQIALSQLSPKELEQDMGGESMTEVLA